MTRRVRATIRTDHEDVDPETVARALAPDNTDEMETVVDGRTVRTRIERETTGGLHSTVDDYVVNLDVAVRVADHATERDGDRECAETDADADGDADARTGLDANEQTNANATETNADADTTSDPEPDKSESP